jgi:hypothetical protein
MVTELGGSVFEFTHDLIGDLFRAKNAGVTVVRLEHGEDPVHRTSGHRQFKLPHHAGEAPDARLIQIYCRR